MAAGGGGGLSLGETWLFSGGCFPGCLPDCLGGGGLLPPGGSLPGLFAGWFCKGVLKVPNHVLLGPVTSTPAATPPGPRGHPAGPMCIGTVSYQSAALLKNININYHIIYIAPARGVSGWLPSNAPRAAASRPSCGGQGKQPRNNRRMVASLQAPQPRRS